MRILVISDIHANLAAFEAVWPTLRANGIMYGAWAMSSVTAPTPTSAAICSRRCRM